MPAAVQEVQVWDRFIRIFHWSVVVLFLLDFWLLEEGDPPHEFAGYALGVLLLARFVWGFIGSRNARFASFWPTPRRLMAHMQQVKSGRLDPHEGHNPLGALMVLFLLLGLSVTVISGWMLTWDAFWGEDWLEDIHELAANAVMLAVCVHVSAVILLGHRFKIALIRPMLTGKRKL